MDSGGDTKSLMKMNVEQILLDLKEKDERDSTDISQIDRVDMAWVEKHLIQPNAQLSALDIIDAQMGDKLQQLARECYIAKASCQAEPSRLVSQLVERCITYTESTRRWAPGNKWRQIRGDGAISLSSIITEIFVSIEILPALQKLYKYTLERNKQG